MAHLGRTILRVYQHRDIMQSALLQGKLGTIIRAGQAMDFAARLREHGHRLTHDLAMQFACFAGIDQATLRLIVLPTLKAVGVIDYTITSNEIVSIEDYVGISAPYLDQLVAVLNHLGPSKTEQCLLHCVEVATWAPLTSREHLDLLVNRGFTEQEANDALSLSLAVGLNRRAPSTHLSDDVIFSPYVWGSDAVDIAAFLRFLPSNERDVLLGVCETAAQRPGLALPQMQAFGPSVVQGARKVGLLQAATVVSTTDKGSRQTYLFSPLLEGEDDKLRTTEALHERKLFIAHILFGHEKAQYEGGRIRNPVVLVDALLRRRVVGPAPNIARDYHLLEASGIVRVEQTPSGPLMYMIKKEIVSDSLALLERTLGPTDDTNSMPPLTLLRAPGRFISPEVDRSGVGEDAAVMEVMHAAVQRLREEAQHAARHDNPFA